MADRNIEFSLVIKKADGSQIGKLTLFVADGLVQGARLKIEDVVLLQAEFAAIQAAYTELKSWAQTNGYNWTAA